MKSTKCVFKVNFGHNSMLGSCFPLSRFFSSRWKCYRKRDRETPKKVTYVFSLFTSFTEKRVKKKGNPSSLLSCFPFCRVSVFLAFEFEDNFSYASVEIIVMLFWISCTFSELTRYTYIKSNRQFTAIASNEFSLVLLNFDWHWVCQ